MKKTKHKQLSLDLFPRKYPRMCLTCGGAILAFGEFAQCINMGWECSTIYYAKDLNTVYKHKANELD